MSSGLDPELARLLADEPPPQREPWQPSPWWAWTAACSLAGFALLAWSGNQLASAELGTLLRARACDVSPVGGLILLAAGSWLLALGARITQLRNPALRGVWSVRGVAAGLVAPAVMLVVTMPGVLGCPSAGRIAEWGLIGTALVGRSGLMLAAAALALVGALLAGCLHVERQPSHVSSPDA